MSAIYRSYEVLVEETASNHKTRGVGKTNKDFKPHFENTCHALRVTHELFQDAICYYILCLVGLVKNECDKNGEPINRMWNFLSGNPATATTTVLARLASRYPGAPFHEASNLHQFLALTYGWKLAASIKPTPESLLLTYRLLFQQAVKASNKEDQSSALENLKTFAGNWIAILCNEDGDTTIPGQGIFDKLHRQLGNIDDRKPEAVWKIVDSIAKQALQTKATMDANWKRRESVKLIARNAKAERPKSAAEITTLCAATFDEKLQGGLATKKRTQNLCNSLVSCFGFQSQWANDSRLNCAGVGGCKTLQ